jgi:hypothetical protein
MNVSPSGTYNVQILNASGVDVYVGTNPIAFSSKTPTFLVFKHLCSGLTQNFTIKTTKVGGTKTLTKIISDVCVLPTNTTAATSDVLTRIDQTVTYTYEATYNANYNPLLKFGNFNVAGNMPSVFDVGFNTFNTYLSPNTTITDLGFSHITQQAYTTDTQGTLPKYFTYPQPKLAFHQNIDPIIAGSKFADDISSQEFRCNGTPAEQDDKQGNVFGDFPTNFYSNNLNTTGTNGDADIASFDLELLWELSIPDQKIIDKRCVIESGIYSNLADFTFLNNYKNQYVRFWNDFIAVYRSKFNRPVKLLRYGAMVNPSQYLYSGLNKSQQYSGASGWSWSLVPPNSTATALGNQYEYSSGQYYIGEPFGVNDRSILPELLNCYEQARYNDTTIPIKPVVPYIKIFQENVTGANYYNAAQNNTTTASTDCNGNCTNCCVRSGNKNIVKAMALIPFFAKGGFWLWGTKGFAEFGQSIDDFIAGRKIASQLNYLITGAESYIIPQISVDGGSTWLGYNDWSSNFSQTNGLSPYDIKNNGLPMVRAIKNGNDVGILLIKNSTSATQQVKFRIPKTGGYYTSPGITLNDEPQVYKLKIN